MFRESLICVILLVIIYQLYSVYYTKKVPKKRFKSKRNKRVTSDSTNDITNDSVSVQKMVNKKPMQYETPQSFEHPTLGKPDEIIQEVYLFRIQNPNPWNAIVYNPNNKFNYLFILRIEEDKNILSRYNDLMRRWSEILPNSSLNENSGELIIPSNDENTALAFANLIINTFKGDLDINNIIQNKLIDISLAKIKNYPSVKQKIKEQILENLGKKYVEEKNMDYEEDLAETATISTSSPNSPLPENKESKSKNESIQAYEGCEFSYI